MARTTCPQPRSNSSRRISITFQQILTERRCTNSRTLTMSLVKFQVHRWDSSSNMAIHTHAYTLLYHISNYLASIGSFLTSLTPCTGMNGSTFYHSPYNLLKHNINLVPSHIDRPGNKIDYK